MDRCASIGPSLFFGGGGADFWSGGLRIFLIFAFAIFKTILKTTFHMANWFECKVRYDKMMENGLVKKVNEPYMVDALSFTEAEARIIEEQTPFISGDFSVSAVKRTKISEIFRDDTADKWYLVKVAFITIDEKTAAEKRSVSQILTAGSDFKNAYDNFMNGMKGTMADFDIVSITETPIMDVYNAKLAKEAGE